MDKIHRIVTLAITPTFIGLQPVTYNLVILEPVHDLLTFDKKVFPLTGIIGMQTACLAFLGNDQVGLGRGVETAVEKSKIGLGKEITLLIGILT